MASKRSLLLPPYLDSNPVWVDYVSAIDTIWYDQVDQPVKALKNLRRMYLIPDVTEQLVINKYLMIDSLTQLDSFEKDVLINQTNLLGMQLTNSDLLDDQDYQRIVRNLGRFWYEKGTKTFIDFISYCIDANLSMANLWSYSEDGLNYGPFIEEKDTTFADTVLEMYHGPGSRASTPHSSNYNPSNTMELTWYGKLNAWGQGYRQSLISKWNGSGVEQRQFILRVSTDGHLVFVWSTDGTNAGSTGVASTNTLYSYGILDGQKIGIKCLVTLNDGTSHYSIQFQIRIGGNQWKTIDTLTGVTFAIFNATAAPLEVGTTNTGLVDNAVGQFVRARIKTDGIVRADLQSNMAAAGAPSLTDQYGKVWTVGAPAKFIKATSITPVWQGGTWFPTTHVRVSFDMAKFAGINILSLATFFYEFANYNLVLRDITTETDIPILSEGSSDNAYIVNVLGIAENEWYIDNF